VVPVDGRFPTIVERTPYNRANAGILQAAHFFAHRGYAFVAQDVRGRGDSGGHFHHLLNEPNEGLDGFDTLAWIVSQPWCSGRIGTQGGSFTAANQQAMALYRPPGLYAQFLRDCGTNYYRRMFRYHGAFHLGVVLPFCARQGTVGKEAQADPAVRAGLAGMRDHLVDWLDRLPLHQGESPLALAPDYEAFFLKVSTEADDTAYWHNPGVYLEGRWDDYPTDVAVFMISGWYAHHVAANIDKLRELGHRLTKPVHLLVGPWIHNATMGEDTHAGDVEFGPDAGAYGPILDLRLRWFDRFLKDLPNGVEDEPPLRLFVMGTGDGHKTAAGRLFHGGSWRTARAWPLPGTEFTTYYLHSGGHLAPQAPPEDAAPSEYDFDPNDPCPAIGGNVQEAGVPGFLVGGPWDQRGRADLHACHGDTRPLIERPDVLGFQTEPLAEPIEVTGPLATRIWVASSAVDTDFTARLVDLYPPSTDYPDGYALLIAEGILRLRFRDDRPVGAPITPGEAYEISIELQPTSNIFKAGHRIRVDISSAAFPQYDVNPNTGEPLGQHTRTVVAHQTVYHDAQRPSRIVLPVVSGASR
jgi:putative CocE/NonD family hydrolase